MATVTTQEELRAAVAGLDPEIIIANDIALTSPLNINYATMLSGESGTKIIWQNPAALNRNMLIVGADGDLTINSLTLDGDARNGTLIQISGGNVVLNAAALQNISSGSAQCAVHMGDYTTVGSSGTLTMNDSLVTGVASADAIFSYSGSVTMNNSTIADNSASAIALLKTTNGVRPSLTMTGKSAILRNTSSNAPSGIIIMEGDAVVGASEGDAIIIEGNTSTGYYYGGIYANRANVNVGFDTKIINNSALYAGGIGGENGSVINISGNVLVASNEGVLNAGALLVSNATLNLSGRVKVTGNITPQICGGICVLDGGTVNISDDVQITDNTAGQDGGGLYLSQNSVASISGNVLFSGNTATRGNDIFSSRGRLNLSGSPRITGGFYNESTLQQTGELPTITGALGDDAVILMETTEHFAPQFVPIVFAVKGGDYAALTESDRAAWRLPDEFGAWHNVLLTEALDGVLVDLATFTITYNNLGSATHTNPTSFTHADLPIMLQDPSHRQGLAFAGWFDEEGQRVTQIGESRAGSVVLTAKWEQLYVYFEGNAPCVCDLPPKIKVTRDRTIIPAQIPTRPCHLFIGWNIPESGSGKTFYAGDIIIIADQSITLCAQWTPAR